MKKSLLLPLLLLVLSCKKENGTDPYSDSRNFPLVFYTDSCYSDGIPSLYKDCQLTKRLHYHMHDWAPHDVSLIDSFVYDSQGRLSNLYRFNMPQRTPRLTVDYTYNETCGTITGHHTIYSFSSLPPTTFHRVFRYKGSKLVQQQFYPYGLNGPSQSKQYGYEGDKLVAYKEIVAADITTGIISTDKWGNLTYESIEQNNGNPITPKGETRFGYSKPVRNPMLGFPISTGSFPAPWFGPGLPTEFSNWTGEYQREVYTNSHLLPDSIYRVDSDGSSTAMAYEYHCP